MSYSPDLSFSFQNNSKSADSNIPLSRAQPSRIGLLLALIDLDYQLRFGHRMVDSIDQH
jgi:hypothetical protein